nr:MAG TPA: hypothetical protein [Caudoviricetes sp.]
MTRHPKANRHSRHLSTPCPRCTIPDRLRMQGRCSPAVRLNCYFCRCPKNHPFC